VHCGHEVVIYYWLPSPCPSWWMSSQTMWSYSSSSALGGKVPAQDTALPHCTAMESLCRRKVVSLGSPVTKVVLRPSSLIKSKPSVFHGPNVSIATGTKICVGANAAYFWCLRIPAWATAAPAELQVLVRWDWTTVSEHVASHVKHLPLDHGINVVPSGLKLLPAIKLVGSLDEATLAIIIITTV